MDRYGTHLRLNMQECKQEKNASIRMHSVIKQDFIRLEHVSGRY